MEIKKIGTLLHANNVGYFVSDLKGNLIQPEWDVAVKAAVGILRKDIPGIVSVYVRGSVATGRAIEGVSDIDFFVITKKTTRDVYKQRAYAGLSTLNENFPYVSRFDVGYYTHEQILNVKERVLIKLRAVCVHGKDISGEIPMLRPGRDVCVTLLGLEKEIEQTMSEIQDGYYTSENTKAMCTWMMKRLVRAGLELVSERQKAYSRDLFVCHEAFCLHYPELEKISYRAMELALYPEDDLGQIKEMIRSLGGFLVQESKRMALI
ncbi:MAG TPA: nucleotidyltransferase domain-containing protein [Candidatus Paceibacterota bacterium]